MITWINCSERMPPDDGMLIVKGKVIRKITGNALRSLSMYNIDTRNLSWCPYTEEAWSELTG